MAPAPREPKRDRKNIRETETLLTMIDDVQENPCRKGLVTRALDWKWSSAAWYVDPRPVPLQPDPIPEEWLADTRLGP